VPPKEEPKPKQVQENKQEALSIEQLKEKFKKQGEERKRKMTNVSFSESLSDYIAGPKAKKTKKEK